MLFKKGITLVKQKNVRMFLFAFLISLSVWFLINLSKTYEETVTVKLVYTELDQGTFVKNYDSILKVKIKGSGFALLSQNKTDVTLNVNTKQMKSGWSWTAEDSQLQQLFSKRIAVTNTTPKIINYTVDTLFKKRVPVLSQLYVTPKLGYGITGYKLSKDSIFVYGDKEHLNDISSVKTDSLKFENITESITGKVKLNFSTATRQVEVDEITYEYTVEQFTQGDFNVAIQIKNLVEGKEIAIFPKEVHVQFQGALSKFSTYSPESFNVYVDVNDMNTSNTLPIHIERTPHGVQNARVLKKSVTYLVLDK